MENVITKKNSYGETIVIKLEKGIIKVKHSDLDGKFRTLNTFFKNIILSEDETFMISLACRELTLKHAFPDKDELFGQIFNYEPKKNKNRLK